MGREDWETMPDKNNILIVGNGLDLLTGYKTDYVSFLKYYGNHYVKMHEKVIANTLEKNQIKTRNGKPIDTRELLYCFLKDNSEANVNAFLRKKQMDIIGENQYGKYIDIVRYPDLNTMLYTETWKSIPTMKNVDEIIEVLNTWLTYFQEVYFKNLLNGDNWIDLEHLILKNVISKDEIDYSYEEHLENLGVTLTANEQFAEFLDMKRMLVEYLMIEKMTEKNEIKVDDYVFSNYGTILNFNYSTNECFRHENRYCTTVWGISEYTPFEIFIHGEFYNENKIVFGFDDGIAKDSTTKRNLLTTKDKKYSKTSQLLSLATHNSEYGVNIELPRTKEIAKIGVLGHGLGEADYNYFETLANFETVIIEVFWYKFRDKETGKKTDENNKQALMDSLVNMIHEMEERKGEVILHKMLIEQRIIFREFEYRVNEEDKRRQN